MLGILLTKSNNNFNKKPKNEKKSLISWLNIIMKSRKTLFLLLILTIKVEKFLFRLYTLIAVKKNTTKKTILNKKD